MRPTTHYQPPVSLQYLLEQMSAGVVIHKIRKPSKKIALLLSTAVNPVINHEGPVAYPGNHIERESQYFNGISSLVRYVDSGPQIEVFWVDNTIEGGSMPSERLEKMAARMAKDNKVFFSDNKLGQENKGAGVIVQWRRFLDRLDNSFEQIIHFEPRLEVVGYEFFDRAISNPTTNLLKVNRFWRRRAHVMPWPSFHVETGLFSIRRETLAQFAFSQDLVKMAADSISIEYSLLDFLIKNRVQFVDVKFLNVIRHAPEGPYLM